VLLNICWKGRCRAYSPPVSHCLQVNREVATPFHFLWPSFAHSFNITFSVAPESRRGFSIGFDSSEPGTSGAPDAHQTLRISPLGSGLERNLAVSGCRIRCSEYQKAQLRQSAEQRDYRSNAATI